MAATITEGTLKDDVSTYIIAHYLDEIKGAHEYLDMAKKAMETNRHNLAEWLQRIAYDEYTHAKFIHEYIHANKLPLSEDDSNKLYLLEKKMQEFPSV